MARPASDAELTTTGIEVAALSDWFRYSLFRVGALVALGLVPVAVALCLTRPNQNVVATFAAALLLAAPLVIAVRRPWEAWRVVFRYPAVLLLVGPLTVVVGILGDRSAFYYPELLWVAAAAIAGGMRWALGGIIIFTLGTTAAGLFSAELDGQQAINEALLVIGPRLVLAVLMAGLFDGLAQIVWLRATETPPPARGGKVIARRPVGRTPYDVEPWDEDEDGVVDAVLVGELDPSPDEPPARARISPAPSRAPGVRRPLTDLERAVLEVMADGMTVAEAAQQLGINARTARARIERALSRNDFHSAPALIRWAVASGYLLGGPEVDRSGSNADDDQEFPSAPARGVIS